MFVKSTKSIDISFKSFKLKVALLKPPVASLKSIVFELSSKISSNKSSFTEFKDFKLTLLPIVIGFNLVDSY